MATLNTDIINLDLNTPVGKLYKLLYDGMIEANQSIPPDTSGFVHDDGTVDEEGIQGAMNEYIDIQMKNHAYNTAKSVIDTVGSGGTGSGGGAVFYYIRKDQAEEDSDAIIAALGGVSPKAGDIAIIIDMNSGSTIEYNRTAFAYKDTSWKALSGLVDTDKVIVKGNIALQETDGITLSGALTNIYNKILNPVASLFDDKSKAIAFAPSHLGHILSVTKDTTESNRGLYLVKDEAGALKKIDILDIDSNGNYTLDGNLISSGWGKFKNGLYVENSVGKSVNLTVDDSGAFFIDSRLKALNGFSIGKDSTTLSLVTENNNTFFRTTGELDFVDSMGISLNREYIINLKNSDVISFSAPNKILNLGDNGTIKLSLQTDVYNDNGDIKLISKSGDGYFPNSFSASYGKGNTLISTYQNNGNSGVLIHDKLSFGTIAGPYLTTIDGRLGFISMFKDTSKETTVSYQISNSLYAPLNEETSALLVSTSANFIQFDKPIEGTSLGIIESKTKLSDGQLFFDDNVYWVALADGVKYYGNNYFSNNLSSVEYSSGFAGSGWQIAKNQLTGNIAATFDELTIRKKMRVYELEVQKNSATNGPLWVSDSCSGDEVILVN